MLSSNNEGNDWGYGFDPKIVWEAIKSTYNMFLRSTSTACRSSASSCPSPSSSKRPERRLSKTTKIVHRSYSPNVKFRVQVSMWVRRRRWQTERKRTTTINNNSNKKVKCCFGYIRVMAAKIKLCPTQSVSTGSLLYFFSLKSFG